MKEITIKKLSFISFVKMTFLGFFLLNMIAFILYTVISLIQGSMAMGDISLLGALAIPPFMAITAAFESICISAVCYFGQMITARFFSYKISYED